MLDQGNGKAPLPPPVIGSIIIAAAAASSISSRLIRRALHTTHTPRKGTAGTINARGAEPVVLPE